MMRLTDSLGNPIGYLPIILNSGETSAALLLRAIPDAPGERLRSSSVADVIILGRIAGGGAYVDLYTSPLDLSAYYGGYAQIEIKIGASGGIVGVRRIAQFLGVSYAGAAGYLF